MNKDPGKINLTLDQAGIDRISLAAHQFLSSQGIDKREITRCSLALEEILLGYLASAAEAPSVTLTMGRRFTIPYVNLEVEGAPANMYSNEAEDQSVLGGSILRRLGLAPEYAWKNGSNIYSFKLHKKRTNPFLTLLIALAAAGLIGGLGMLMPFQTRSAILTSFLDPLHDTFLNMLSCLAGPMVFLSVAWGIYGIGDAATLKRIGKKMLLSNVGTVYLCLLAGGLICIPFFHTFLSGQGSGGGLSAIFSMLLKMIPKNFLSPFIDGNTLQIIFMAIIFGIAMLFLGRKTDSVARAVEQISNIIQFIIDVIGKLVPFFIGIVLISIIWSGTATIFNDLKKLFLLVILTILFSQAIIITVTAIRNHISPLRLIRKGLPTLIIAMSTASSAAAFGSNIKACKNEYGIDEKLSSFGLPLGMAIYKPSTSLSYLIMGFFFAEMYSVEISASWIVMAIFSAGMLGIATPPIPGGAITAYTVLFAQMGIPSEAVAIALACDALFDFICTGFDQFSLPFILLNQAGGFGMVKHNILLRESNHPPKKSSD